MFTPLEDGFRRTSRQPPDPPSGSSSGSREGASGSPFAATGRPNDSILQVIGGERGDGGEENPEQEEEEDEEDEENNDDNNDGNNDDNNDDDGYTICPDCGYNQDPTCCSLCDVENECESCNGNGGDWGINEIWVCYSCLPSCLSCGSKLYTRTDECCGAGRSDYSYSEVDAHTPGTHAFAAAREAINRRAQIEAAAAHDDDEDGDDGDDDDDDDAEQDPGGGDPVEDDGGENTIEGG